MNTTLKLLSVVALGLTIVPCLAFFAGWMGHDGVKMFASVGAGLWFDVTPLWMSRKLPVDANQVEI